jgi:hypothetical protein
VIGRIDHVVAVQIAGQTELGIDEIFPELDSARDVQSRQEDLTGQAVDIALTRLKSRHREVAAGCRAGARIVAGVGVVRAEDLIERLRAQVLHHLPRGLAGQGRLARAAHGQHRHAQRSRIAHQADAQHHHGEQQLQQRQAASSVSASAFAMRVPDASRKPKGCRPALTVVAPVRVPPLEFTGEATKNAEKSRAGHLRLAPRISA